jgi:hypothetical protein
MQIVDVVEGTDVAHQVSQQEEFVELESLD